MCRLFALVVISSSGQDITGITPFHTVLPESLMHRDQVTDADFLFLGSKPRKLTQHEKSVLHASVKRDIRLDYQL